MMQEKFQLEPQRTRHPFFEKLGQREAFVSFDFVTSLPLEECMSRVGSMQDLRDLDLWSPKVRASLNHEKADTCAFRLRESQPAPIEVHGYMNHLESGTYISGQASAKIYLQLGEILFLAALILLLTVFLGLHVFVLFAPLLGGFTWYTWRGARKERDRLVRVLKDTLSSP